MKTHCEHCYDWIAWSRREGNWYHLTTGAPECRYQNAVATRSDWLPLVDFIETDRKLIKP
jgi:hypothetical protein